MIVEPSSQLQLSGSMSTSLKLKKESVVCFYFNELSLLQDCGLEWTAGLSLES